MCIVASARKLVGRPLVSVVISSRRLKVPLDFGLGKYTQKSLVLVVCPLFVHFLSTFCPLFWTCTANKRMIQSQRLCGADAMSISHNYNGNNHDWQANPSVWEMAVFCTESIYCILFLFLVSFTGMYEASDLIPYGVECEGIVVCFSTKRGLTN